MSQRNRGDAMKLVKDLRRQGFDVDRTGSGHWRVSKEGQDGFVILGFSPGSGNRHNYLPRLRAIGYDDSPKSKGKGKARKAAEESDTIEP